MTNLPVACFLGDAGTARRRAESLDRILARAEEKRALEDGYALRFPGDATLLAELMQLIRQERGCCAFLRFRLTVEPGGGPVWLELTGPKGTKSFLETEFGA